jgi:hypothetical protein
MRARDKFASPNFTIDQPTTISRKLAVNKAISSENLRTAILLTRLHQEIGGAGDPRAETSRS